MSFFHREASVSNMLHTDRSTQNLREVHSRLLSFIAAHSALSKATLGLADSIVEFYSPEDDGFAPAVAFQTMAAEGTSGLLCAQIQALVQAAVRPLARFAAEVGEVDTLIKVCKEAGQRSQHYAKKVKDLNTKLETEKREDRQVLLEEKVTRNNAKLAAAHRQRKEVSDKVYRLVDNSLQSRYQCFNPVFASICQFQEATYSHAHLLSTMLLRTVRSSLGSPSLPMATVDAPVCSSPPHSPLPARIPSSPCSTPPPPAAAAAALHEGPQGNTATARNDVDCKGSTGEGVWNGRDDDGDSDGGVAGTRCGRSRQTLAVSFSGDKDAIADAGAGEDGVDAGVTPRALAGKLYDDGDESSRRDYRKKGAGQENVAGDSSRDAGRGREAAGRGRGIGVGQDLDKKVCGGGGGGGGGGGCPTPAVPVVTTPVLVEEAEETTATTSRPEICPPSAVTTVPVPPASVPNEAIDFKAFSPPEAGVAAAAALATTSAPGVDGQQAQRRPSKAVMLPMAGTGGAAPGIIRGAFFETQLPWGKRRRMSGILRRKKGGGGRGAASVRSVFCVAEGPELLMYNSENDSTGNCSPRARFLVKGARSVSGDRAGGLELEVIVVEEQEPPTPVVSMPEIPGSSADVGMMGGMAIPPLTSVQSTRVITLVAPEKREHARWVLALDESKSWKEEVETEALLKELELSLPFRESAFRHLKQNLPDGLIEDILGVTAAKNDPGCVLKSSTFDAAVVATVLASSPDTSIGSALSSHGNNNASAGRVSLGSGLGLGPSAAATGVAPSGRSGSRRGSTGAGSSLRSLLNRFDTGRSPRDNATPMTAMTTADNHLGGWGAAGGSGGGAGRATRWSVGSSRKKRGAGGGGRSPVGGSGTHTSTTSRHNSFSSNPVSPGRGASVYGRVSGASLELGSPLRRQTRAESIGALLTSWGKAGSTGGSDNGGSWTMISGGHLDSEDGAVGSVGGEFIGGGHALCRLRSKSVHTATRSRANTHTGNGIATVFDMFNQVDAPTTSPSITPKRGGRGRGGSDSVTRHPSRERAVILQLLHDAGIAPSVSSHPTHARSRLGTDGGASVTSMYGLGYPARVGGGGRSRAGTVAAGEAGSTAELGAASQSLSAPCTPTGTGRMSEHVSAPWEHQGFGGSGEIETSALAMVPSWSMVGAGRTVGVERDGGGGNDVGAVGGGVGGSEGLRRHSGINPYMTKRSRSRAGSRGSPDALAPSDTPTVEGGDGIANGNPSSSIVITTTTMTTTTTKKWAVWCDKDAMPALPPNRTASFETVGHTAGAPARAADTITANGAYNDHDVGNDKDEANAFDKSGSGGVSDGGINKGSASTGGGGGGGGGGGTFPNHDVGVNDDKAVESAGREDNQMAVDDTTVAMGPETSVNDVASKGDEQLELFHTAHCTIPIPASLPQHHGLDGREGDDVS